MVRQFKTWLTCQICGRVVGIQDSDHWLNQPHRTKRKINVVRCPEHWSEWALRNTKDGRTNANREAMKAAKLLPPAMLPPYASPYPTREQDDAAVNVVRVSV